MTAATSSTSALAPRMAAAAGAFLLYTNLLVVTAQQGLVPAAAAALVPGLLLAAVIHRSVVYREPLVVDRTFVIMVAFLVVLLASALSVKGQTEATSRIVTFGVEGLAIYFLVRNTIRDLSSLRTVMIAVVAAGTLLGALSVFQALTNDFSQDFLGLAQRNTLALERGGAPGADAYLGMEDRAQGPVGEPNRFAQILLMAAPLAFVCCLDARSRVRAWAFAGALAALLGGVIVTYSRGAFLALVILLVLAAPLGLIRARRVLAIGVVGVALTPVLLPTYAQRVLSISGVAGLLGHAEVEADGATQGRTTEMLAALAAFADHAVLGVGPGQYVTYYSQYYQALPEISVREIAEPRRAHNLFLEMAAEVGLIGLLVFMAIPILLLRDLRLLRLELRYRAPPLARLSAAFTLVLLAYMGTGMFLHLAFERYYWLMIALTAGAVGALAAAAEEMEARRAESSPWMRRAAWSAHARDAGAMSPC